MNTFAFLLGGFFVVVSALERFNTPAANRSTTTALRYYTAALMYVLVACGTFLSLAQYPDLLNAIGGDNIPAEVMALPAPLTVALVLTVLLDKVPFFAPLDRWLRARLQEVANIPYEARRLSHRLLHAQLWVDEASKVRIRAKLLENGFHVGDIAFERRESPEYTWTKITLLLEHIGTWESQGKFSAFMAEFAEEFRALKQRYDQLAPKARRCLVHIRELSHDPADARSVEIRDAYKGYFREQADSLLGDLCGFLSRGILCCSVVPGTRGQELRALGFCERLDNGGSYLSCHQLVSLFAVIATMLLFGTVLASKHAGFGRGLGIAVMVATIYVLAIVCALYPKDHWEIARRGAHGERPAAFYAVAGLIAAAVGVAVNFLFKIFLLGWHDALLDIVRSYPWLLCSFGTAAMMAYLTDNLGDEYGRWQRYIEGALQALGMMTVSWLTFLWLESTGFFDPTFRRVDPHNFLVMLMLLSAVNGFALGYLVPAWYRKARAAAAACGEECAAVAPVGNMAG